MNKGKKALAVALSVAVTAAYTLTPACAFASSTTVEKDESVYVITDSTGAQSEVIVSDHLKNGPQLDQIKDKSNLSDIENVKGDETFEQGTGSSITWEAGGNDIYYQGKTNREVPVTIEVTYTLDGKEVSGKELDGKSGDVTIKIKYTNHTSYNGTKVPFIVMSGFMVQDECLTNIKIDNGKVIDDGEKQMVVGMAAPGLAENLGISGDDIGMSDEVNISGKANKFAVDDIMTIVTSSIFEDLDTSELDDLNFDDEIDQLDKGSKKLVEGSKTLYEGIDKMNDKMPDLTEGVDQLAEGAQKLDEGTQNAKQGAENLNDGMNHFSESLGQMISSIPGLYQIARGVLSGLNDIKDGLDGTPGKTGIIGTLEDTKEDMIGKDGSGGTAADAKEVYEYLEKIEPLVEANKDKLAEQDPKYGELAEQIGDIKSKAADVYQNTSKDGRVVGGVTDNLQNISDSLGGYDINLQPSQQKTVIGNMIVLYSGIETMNNSVETISGALGSLVSGSESLAAGEEQLATGAQELAAGMEELQEQSGTLVDGVEKLDGGSLKLSQGMSKLYKEGIKKIVDLYKDDIKGLVDGLDSMMDASKDYKSFTLLPANMDGSTKFIYKTPVTE